MKKLLLGNAAVARGAYEAGVRVVSSYPGTPSTEITEQIVPYKEIYAEPSVLDMASCIRRLMWNVSVHSAAE